MGWGGGGLEPKSLIEVRILPVNSSDAGASLKSDRHGCTPLHSAAMAICPSATIARLLVDAAGGRGADNFRLLNERSNVKSGCNTALHIAAGKHRCSTKRFVFSSIFQVK